MERLLSLILLLLLQNGTWGGQLKQEQENGSVPEIKVFKRAAGDAFSRRSPVDKNFIRFGRSGDYFHELPDRTREKNVMSFARVSRATKDNFMRFGRPENDFEDIFITPTATSLPFQEQKIKHFLRLGRKDNFMRFGRKDNFMRFGRGENFMRFGKAKDNFMRFGRKDNFMRFGRGDNFMRFGKAKDNFMRFGRKDNFMRFGRTLPEIYDDGNFNENIINGEYVGKTPGDKTSFVRYGKSPKQLDGFIRFGRNDPEEVEDQKVEDGSSDVDITDLDLQGDKPKNGPVVRIKRDANPTTLWDLEEPSFDRTNRDSEIVEEIPQTKNGNINKRYVNSDFYEPESMNYESEFEPIELFNEVELPSDKRNGESSFIRFG